MKKLVAAAVVAASCVPAHAGDSRISTDTTSSSACSGHVEGYYGGFQLSSGNSTQDARSYGGAGRVNCVFDERWNAQGDVFVDALRSSSGSSSALVNYGAVAHIYWRDPSSFALGGFASVESYSNMGSFDGTKRYIGGAEGQIYLDNVTLYGQAYLGQHTINSTTADIKGVRGVLRYFPTENIRLEGELGFRRFRAGSDGPDIASFAAEAEYRFDDSPVSLFGRYQLDHLMVPGNSWSMNVHKYTAGLKLSFGSRTLFEEDRHGAAMDTTRVNYFLY